MRRIVALLALVGCSRMEARQRDAEAQEEARKADAAAQLAAMASAVEAQNSAAASAYTVAMDAWSVKTRKACGLKPDAAIFGRTKRQILEDCQEKIRSFPTPSFRRCPTTMIGAVSALSTAAATGSTRLRTPRAVACASAASTTRRCSGKLSGRS